MFKLPQLAIAGSLLALPFTSVVYAADVNDITDDSPYYYQADPGSLVVPGLGDPNDSTDSGINHLPVYHGNMQTNKTYRFVNVMEQVFTMIGDGKHGLWRYQDNGTIREYNTDTTLATGLTAPDDADLKHPDEMADYVAGLSAADIGSQYAHVFDTGGDFSGYKSNANVAPGAPAPFLDLPIFHERYQGKYAAHVPIDLPAYYCTMSEPGFLKAKAAMDFAFAQPAAGKVGPLGKRAGLDIEENYPRVLRLQAFPDGEVWANTRSEDSARWQQVNPRRTEYEIYLVERPFFNEPYLFLVVVFDDNTQYGHGDKYSDDGDTRNKRSRRASQHSYIRPHGTYYEHLQQRKADGAQGNRSMKPAQPVPS